MFIKVKILYTVCGAYPDLVEDEWKHCESFDLQNMQTNIYNEEDLLMINHTAPDWSVRSMMNIHSLAVGHFFVLVCLKSD